MTTPRNPYVWIRTPDGRLNIGEASRAWHDIGASLGVSFREFLDRVGRFVAIGPDCPILIPLPLPIYRALRGGAKHRGRTPLPIARLLPRRRKELGP